MNDYQMHFLANQRRNELLAEADRQRRARAVPAPPQRTGRRRPRSRHLSLGLLYGRVLF